MFFQSIVNKIYEHWRFKCLHMFEQINAQIAEAVSLSTRYLEQEVATMTDPYELAITSYALSLAGSMQARVAIEKLQSQVTVESM